MPTIRLAQMFDVKGTFVPTRVSVYLKRVGSNTANDFSLDKGSIVIDASNFASITQQDNKIVFDDRISDFTGNGFMQLKEFVSSAATNYASVNYNIETAATGKYNLYLRGHTDTGTFQASVLLDGIVVDTINESAGAGWRWFTSSLVLPDPDEHVLGIRLEDNNNALDKVYINRNSDNPSGTGPALSVSPYVNVHVQIYETKKQVPTDPLLIYDWKTTKNEVIADDWYYFNIKPISSTVSINFTSTYAIVLSATGGDNTNFVIWELVDNDEYAILPSAIRV